MLLSFGIGNILGALLAWPRAPNFLKYVMPPVLMMSAIPYFLLGLILVYVFGFTWACPDVWWLHDGIIPSLTVGFVWTSSCTPCCPPYRSSWSQPGAGHWACDA